MADPRFTERATGWSPKVSFGKKCMVKDESVSYSYVWLYDKNTGLPASAEQCEALPKKD